RAGQDVERRHRPGGSRPSCLRPWQRRGEAMACDSLALGRWQECHKRCRKTKRRAPERNAWEWPSNKTSLWADSVIDDCAKERVGAKRDRVFAEIHAKSRFLATACLQAGWE